MIYKGGGQGGSESHCKVCLAVFVCFEYAFQAHRSNVSPADFKRVRIIRNSAMSLRVGD
jgi:hypothetical protein